MIDLGEPRTRKRLITAGATAVVLIVLAIVAPEVYTGTFSDLGTFLRVAAVAAILAAIAFAARRWIPNRTVASVVAIAPIVVVAIAFVWPYVRPATEVDEAFPPVSVPPPTTTAAEPTTTPPTTTPPTTTPPTTTPPAEAAEPDAASSTIAATTTTSPPTTVPPTTTPPTTAPPQTEPIELGRATFQGLTGHRGSGDTAVYRLVDQSLLLRFEEVDIGSGPDLDVYIVPGEDRRNLDGATYVADLTAERGNQNYTPPPGVDITSGVWTVLVWCETFDVEVANATLVL